MIKEKITYVPIFTIAMSTTDKGIKDIEWNEEVKNLYETHLILDKPAATSSSSHLDLKSCNRI